MHQCLAFSFRQRGLALALLVWMIAALALMAAGILAIARTDMQLAQMQSRDLQAAALGDGAVRLFLRDRLDMQRYGEFIPGVRVTRRYQLAGRDVVVRSQPAEGLIDINAASEALWLDLLQFGAGVSEADSRELVAQLMLWKLPPQEAETPRRSGQFLAVEDLLLVPGITRELLEKIRPSVHAYGGGSGGVSLMSAAASVVKVLARGDEALVQGFLGEREQNPFAVTQGYPGLTPEHVSPSASSVMRVDVRLALPDGKALLYRRWVDTNRSGRDGLPWQFLRAEPVVMVASIEFDD